eukprot:scaffold915_cov65-Cylindrotheca_fusiformis.AAC.5
MASSTSTTELKDTDIVCGRGGLANKHPGNRVLRRICSRNRDNYRNTTDPNLKNLLVVSIVMAIENRGGRFVTQSNKDGTSWEEISEKKKKAKTAQLLRENDPPSRTSSPSTSSIRKQVRFAQEDEKNQRQSFCQEDDEDDDEEEEEYDDDVPIPDVIPPDYSSSSSSSPFVQADVPYSEDFTEFVRHILPTEKDLQHHQQHSAAACEYFTTSSTSLDTRDLKPLEADREYAFEHSRDYHDLCDGILSVLSA